MQQLVGRLNSLDPEAGEILQVVSYFDVLISRGAGIDGLLRGAALLSGTVAGAEVRGRVSRRDPDGRTPGPDPAAPHCIEEGGATWRVWLERSTDPGPHDAIIVERLAVGVQALEARRSPENAVEIVVDANRPLEERVAALARLGIRPTRGLRVLATPAASYEGGAPSAVVPTRAGLLRATLDVSGDGVTARPLGIGLETTADRAPESWDSAVIALHLTDDTVTALDASDLGAMLLLAKSYDPRAPHADVVALGRLDQRSAEVLQALVESDSIRSAASKLAMHHSTLQARHQSLTRTLGYDPRTALGRMRYIAAALLLRLSEAPRR